MAHDLADILPGAEVEGVFAWFSGKDSEGAGGLG
jgi:hypothetical protein